MVFRTNSAYPRATASDRASPSRTGTVEILLNRTSGFSRTGSGLEKVFIVLAGWSILATLFDTDGQHMLAILLHRPDLCV